MGLSIAIYYDLIAVSAVHLACCLNAVRWPSPATDLEDTIIDNPLIEKNNIIYPNDKPGLGVDLNFDKIEKYKIEI